ncbi:MULTISPECIES: hypothetical protein [Bradyrhizobium]|jgi:hypothetical protein|uniref:hypothetical protein n=1 Tax=Bradyrhizobium TaxID=374 RepID=UPI0003F5DBC7|nr:MULTISPECIES: hypothetical protein [Bradyrhizobium]KIU44677.1 hypothetical protein QU41_27575 [Bradyrhizobium elkanii]MBK5653730.1 hypothetical protein [Rhizobium sp.]OCX26410.1 hypothetical protein QU42_34695 [Bradyrhizobium sp. UASWS1016]
MKNFSNAAFAPEVIELMTRALESSVATLPDPVSSSHIKTIAESILRTAKDGEREIDALQRIALLELALAPRD